MKGDGERTALNTSTYNGNVEVLLGSHHLRREVTKLEAKLRNNRIRLVYITRGLTDYTPEQAASLSQLGCPQDLAEFNARLTIAPFICYVMF